MNKTAVAALALILGIATFAGASIFEEPGPGPKPAANPQAKIMLFNGKDTSGWHPFLEGGADAAQTKTWSVSDGVLHCSGTPAGYIRTTEQYENYKLTFEYRFAGKGGNGGVLVHIQTPDQVWPKSIETQMLDQHAADLFVIAGSEFKEHTNPDDRRVPITQAPSEKPLGEWNTYEVVCDKNTITVFVNGVMQNRATETNIAKGYIGLQSEGVPMDFRNIVLEPLPR
jgi:hypothetical protein